LEKRWRLYPAEAEKAKLLTDELDISGSSAQLLLNRGISSPSAAREFLSPQLGNLLSPSLLKDLDKAVQRIVRAIEGSEKISIYGDYDVDGTTSTALLLHFLSCTGARCGYYIPDRMTEGYGLNSDAVRKLAERGTTLIITVDNGISSFDEVVLASTLGVDVIVTDHHQIPDKIPDAFAVINPLQEDCSYPSKELAGVGIAFNLAAGVRAALRERGFWKERNEPAMKAYLDLVALGTIADIAPLTGMNRLFAAYGLKELTKGSRAGVRALKRVSGKDEGDVNVGTVGFQLAPRLNPMRTGSMTPERLSLPAISAPGRA